MRSPLPGLFLGVKMWWLVCPVSPKAGNAPSPVEVVLQSLTEPGAKWLSPLATPAPGIEVHISQSVSTTRAAGLCLGLLISKLVVIHNHTS